MAEVAAAAAIIAILQLSQAVLSTCCQYISSTKNAPREIRKAASEIGSLQVLLCDLKVLAESTRADPNRTLPSLLKAADVPNGPLKSCEAALVELREMLGSPARMVSLGRAIVWPWKEKDVNRLLDGLQKHKNSILLAANTDQTFVMLDLQREVRDLKKSFEQGKVLAWLSSVDPSVNHNAACDKQEPMTGNWFLESPEFAGYLFGDNRCLWCHGIPGCGKTILFSTVVEYIRAMYGSLPGTQYAYFYFDFNESMKQNATGMLRSVLAQLANRNNKIMAAVEELFAQCSRGSHQPQRRELLSIWSLIKEDTPKTYLLLDALDECTEREALMTLLSDMHSSGGENIAMLATSRRERQIEIVMTKIATSSIALESSRVDPDIKLFIRNCLASDNRLQKWSDSIKEEIQVALSERAQGMFRLVVCQLSDLRKSLRLPVLRATLEQLPKTLDEMYERILVTIPEDYRAEAIAALRWLVFSLRPMTLAEVAEAIVICPDRFDISERLLDIVDVLEICSGLVTLVEPSIESNESLFLEDDDEDWIDHNKDERDHNVNGGKQLRLAHFSVQEFLLSERIASLSSSARLFALSPTDAHVELARACLLYLTSEYFQSGACITKSELEIRLKAFPFLSYATGVWFRHVKQPHVEDRVHDLLLRLMVPQKNKALAAALQATEPPKRFLSILSADERGDWGYINFDHLAYYDATWMNMNSLAIAAEAGLNSVLGSIVESGAEIDAPVGIFGNALQTAAFFGNYIGVATLLELGADINCPCVGTEFGTALVTAIRRNHHDIVDLLLKKGADPAMANQGYVGTALNAAAAVNNVESIKVLIKADSDLATKLFDAVKWGVRFDSVEAVALLLQYTEGGLAGADWHDLFSRASDAERAEELKKCFIDAGYQPRQVNKGSKEYP